MLQTFPKIRFPALGSDPNEIIWWSLHSKFIGESATRGGFTTVDCFAAISAATNSLTPGGYGALVWFIFCARPWLTTFTTNSPVCLMFTSVSFSCELSNKSGEKHSIGGLTLATVKNENGARFMLPEASRVETQAMGNPGNGSRQYRAY